MSKELQATIDAAHRAQAGVAHYGLDGTVKAVTPRAAACVAHHDMRKLEIVAPTDTARRISTSPLLVNAQAGGVTTLDAAMLESSAFIRSGAHMIWDDASGADARTTSGGELIWTEQRIRFSCIEPATYAYVSDGDELATVPLPIAHADLDRAYSRQMGVRFNLTRREQKDYESGELAAQAMLAIGMGLGQAVDQVLADALLLSSPAAFSLSAVIGAGFNPGELTAVVGTAATGAAIEPTAGRFHVDGLPALATPVMAPTVIGAWNRAAVAVDSNISLIAERLSVDGAMALTAWVNIFPMFPRLDAFWLRAA